MNLALYTLSFEFENEYKVVFGYRILGMNKNELLGAAFSYDGTWHVHRYYLGEFQEQALHPEEGLVRQFGRFLETLRIHFEGESYHVRRESNGWKLKQQVYHELTPSQLEMDQVDKYNVCPKIDHIVKLSSF